MSTFYLVACFFSAGSAVPFSTTSALGAATSISMPSRESSESYDLTSIYASSGSTSSVFFLTSASRFPISFIRFSSSWTDSRSFSLSVSARTRLGDESRRPSLFSSLNSFSLRTTVRCRLVYVYLMSVSVLVSLADSSIASKKSSWSFWLTGSCY